MNTIYQAWKKGWIILFKIWAFLFLVHLCLFPFYLLSKSIDMSEEPLVIKIPAVIGVIIIQLIVLPLLFYLINAKFEMIDPEFKSKNSTEKSVFREKQKQKYRESLNEDKNI